MIRNRVVTAVCTLSVALLSFPLYSQEPSSGDLKKTIESLNESQKAILKELQEIRKLIAQQGQGRAADALPSAPVAIGKEPFRGPANAKVAVIEYSDYQCP